MGKASEPNMFQPGPRRLRVLRRCVLCLAVFAGYAWGGPQTLEPKPREKPKAGLRNTSASASVSERKPKADVPPKGKAKPAVAAKLVREGKEKIEAGSKGTSDAASERKPEADLPPKGKAKRAVAAKVAREGKDRDRGNRNRSRAGTPKRKPGFTMEPNAKWVCAKPTQTHEPIWRNASNGRVTFTFHIRNEGTADLRIKARGG